MVKRLKSVAVASVQNRLTLLAYTILLVSYPVLSRNLVQDTLQSFNPPHESHYLFVLLPIAVLQGGGGGRVRKSASVMLTSQNQYSFRPASALITSECHSTEYRCPNAPTPSTLLFSVLHRLVSRFPIGRLFQPASNRERHLLLSCKLRI